MPQTWVRLPATTGVEKRMKPFRNVAAAVLFCAAILLLIAPPAYAYIDPNAAGLVSQILTPLLVFAAAGVTFFRKRLADAYHGLSRRLRRRPDAERT